MTRKKTSPDDVVEASNTPTKTVPWWRKIVDETPIFQAPAAPDGYDFGGNAVYFEDMDDMIQHRCRLRREREEARKYGVPDDDRRNWTTR